MRPVMVGLTLVDERLAVVPDWDRSDVDQPYILNPGFVHGVLRTDDRTGDPIGAGEVLCGFGSGHPCLRCEDVRAALESQVDKLLLLDGGNKRRQREFPKGLGCG